MEDQLGLLSDFTPEKRDIYRPNTSSGRLAENFSEIFPNRDVYGHWTPSLSYKHTLDDIQNQFTPAEYYRHTLVTSGKIIRQIFRLEARWKRNFDAFTKAAIKVQSLQRGIVARKAFSDMKDYLVEQYQYREGKRLSIELFNQRNFQQSIDTIDGLPFYTDLAVIKMKCHYRSREYLKCVQAADSILGT